MKRLPKEQLEAGRAANPPITAAEGLLVRPRTRAGCAGLPRPCPFVSCSMNLYLDVLPRTGALRLNFPDIEPDQMPADGSCALDVADAGAAEGTTLERVGELTNLTRERIRLIENEAKAKLGVAPGSEQLEEYAAEPSAGGGMKRRLPLLHEVESEEPEDDQEAGYG